jgi:predicted DNA-binding transcriptional regulator AlpA
MSNILKELILQIHPHGSPEETEMSNFLRELDRKRVLKLRDVCKIVCLSRQTIYRYMKMNPPRFPQSVKIGVAAVGWTAESIAHFLAEREIESIKINSIQ